MLKIVLVIAIAASCFPAFAVDSGRYRMEQCMRDCQDNSHLSNVKDKYNYCYDRCWR
ncbi:hypothetical protein [Legionella fallonii]|uniref:Uncharacterized protein n=1 Tax=Legionella fallonii LLAP-10 TaxID=1212491 RepID=A0A098G5B3_9GAMM|nr:hypothetical protein [Legionella fallonii]CEG57171.1 exported protein of unknown function [Legionella fallonii LLAP-10]